VIPCARGDEGDGGIWAAILKRGRWRDMCEYGEDGYILSSNTMEKIDAEGRK